MPLGFNSLEAMPPERLEPKKDEPGGDDCRAENYAERGERLIPPCRKWGQLRLHEIRLVHDLSEVIAGLGGLAEGRAVGIEIGHAAMLSARELMLP
jgi:hypothetical protein